MFLPYLFTYTEMHTFTVIVSLSLSAETDKRCRYELWQGAYSFIYFAFIGSSNPFTADPVKSWVPERPNVKN